MRNLMLALLAVGTVAAAAATPAEASGGCGPYRHRTYYGACAPGGQFGFAPRPYFYRPRPYVYGPRPYVYGPRLAFGYGYGWPRPFFHRHRYW